MALDTKDLADMRNLMTEVVSPMFEEQAGKIDELEQKLEKFRIETKDHLSHQDYELDSIKTFCKEIENKALGSQSDIIEILDRITSIEKGYYI